MSEKIEMPAIRLANIKHHPDMSEETECYSAVLWVNGKRFAEVGNRGDGGPDMVHPLGEYTKADVDRLDAIIALSYPKYKFYGEWYEHSLETVCGDLLQEHVNHKAWCNLLRRNWVVFDQGSIYTLKRLKNQTSDHVSGAIASKYPGAVFLNPLSTDEAMSYFARAARKEDGGAQ